MQTFAPDPKTERMVAVLEAVGAGPGNIPDTTAGRFI
jgi:hypothetical protein